MIVNIAESQTLAVKAEKHVPLVFIDPMKFERGLFAQAIRPPTVPPMAPGSAPEPLLPKSIYLGTSLAPLR